jgi:hypothetical protein
MLLRFTDPRRRRAVRIGETLQKGGAARAARGESSVCATATGEGCSERSSTDELCRVRYQASGPRRKTRGRLVPERFR